ncbi:hypothetical protein ABID30_001676 [Enterococcus rotai]|uniref:Uncharacterized protein n=1 Tax=Enterococcus rotai TaxID=118060 RepID=A0A0U2XC43_9ENTE|nr:hypothetical protein [Enterococcus rotai]ALS37688.1 hypothetical protein ATZ35_11160 [Enterococcus rotai]
MEILNPNYYLIKVSDNVLGIYNCEKKQVEKKLKVKSQFIPAFLKLNYVENIVNEGLYFVNLIEKLKKVLPGLFVEPTDKEISYRMKIEKEAKRFSHDNQASYFIYPEMIEIYVRETFYTYTLIYITKDKTELILSMQNIKNIRTISDVHPKSEKEIYFINRSSYTVEEIQQLEEIMVENDSIRCYYYCHDDSLVGETYIGKDYGCFLCNNQIQDKITFQPITSFQKDLLSSLFQMEIPKYNRILLSILSDDTTLYKGKKFRIKLSDLSGTTKYNERKSKCSCCERYKIITK